MHFKRIYLHPRHTRPASTGWILTWILLICSCVATEQCPEYCSCTPQPNGTRVDCSATDLQQIPDNIPMNTITLDLGYNNISNIVTSSLPVFNNVKELKLDNNAIKTLFNNVFEKFPSLQVLSLGSNRIANIPENAFNGLLHLRHLDLQSNKLLKLQSGVFKNLNLQKLILNNNLIQSIESSDFEGASISELQLDDNDILALGQDTFTHLRGSLTKFYLSYNQCPVSVDPSAFQDLNLTHLSMCFDGLNDVSFIEKLVTRKLDLSGNQFRISSLRDYPSLANVEELYLVNCSIDSLDADYFVRLNNLKTLDLSQNHLKLLPRDVFKHTSQIRDLIANENKLEKIDFTATLPHLEILLLSSNQIKAVAPSFFSHFNSHLLELDLSYNLIQVLDQEIEQFIDYIPTLSFHGNPFHCNCEMRWFREWLQTRESYTGVYNCRSPTPGYIMDRNPDEFVCKEPVIKFLSHDVTVSEGDQVFLTCTAEGDPAPVVQFETPLEGSEYSVSPPKNRTNMRTIAAYNIPTVGMNEAGAYVCKATNVLGYIVESTQVTIRKQTSPPPLPVVIVTIQHSVTSEQDDTVEISTVSAAPETTVKSKNKISKLFVIIIVVCVALFISGLFLVMYLVARYARNYRNSDRYSVYRQYRKQKPNSDRVDYYKMNGRPPEDRRSNGIAMV